MGAGVGVATVIVAGLVFVGATFAALAAIVTLLPGTAPPLYASVTAVDGEVTVVVESVVDFDVSLSVSVIGAA